MGLPKILGDFTHHLPIRPYYWDDLTGKARWSNQQLALASSRIQFNPKHAWYWMVVDVDHPMAALAWEDCDLPPTLIIQNIAGRLGHAHLLYRLVRPVIVAKGKEGAKAVRLYGRVRRGLTAAIGGDKGYSNFMCKNPINASAHGFRVTSVRNHPYTLNEIACRVDMSLPTSQLNGNEGRNCFTFATVSKWAYRNCYRYTDRDAFIQAVRAQCDALGMTFYEPLPHSEVAGIVQSIVRFVWGRFIAPPSEDVGPLRLDPSLPLTKRQSLGATHVNRSRKEATEKKIGMAKGRLGDGVTQVGVVGLTGLSLSTVKRHWHSSPVVDICGVDWS
ncbi:MAG: replication initiation protein [Anaerolineales bacterium]